MTITIVPGATVTSNTPITAGLLNAGFNPTAQVTGQIQASDIADGAVQGRHLATGLIGSLPDVAPGPASYVLVESSGPTLGRATVAQLAEAIPGETVLEKGFDLASTASTALGTDELMVYRSTQPAGSRLFKVTADNFALPDIVTAGTYRAGLITIDAKGRVTNINPDGGYYKSADSAIPSPLSAASFAHGLGATPAFAQVFLKCVTAEHGYSAGDIVPGNAWSASVSGYEFPALLPLPTATVIMVYNYSTSAANLRMARKSDGASVTPTPANWVFFVTARL